MAKDEKYSYKQKQALLYAKDPKAEDLTQHGKNLIELDCLNDAIDFFAKASNKEGLLLIKKKAIEEGDAFLAHRIEGALAGEMSPEDWMALAEQAESLEKFLFAREGYRVAGDMKAMDKVDAKIKPIEKEIASTEEEDFEE